MLAMMLPLLLMVNPPASDLGPANEISLILQVKSADADQARLLDDTARVVSSRLKLAYIDNAEVKPLAGGKLSIHLPIYFGLPERVRDLVSKTGALEFRLVRAPKEVHGARSREELLSSFPVGVPVDVEILEGNATEGRVYFAVERRLVIEGRALRSAHPTMSSLNQPSIAFEIAPEAAEAFRKATGDHIGSNLAIVLDGEVLSAPRIYASIAGSGLIEGRFTLGEVEEIAALMASGPLPAPVSVVEEKVVPFGKAAGKQ
ncbi:MAG TPA: hypothetical protein VH394_22710 [Thermoanaerobaculia bacterium]|nr:hypothetical protein [Thermoanaerobaculia bacterium]